MPELAVSVSMIKVYEGAKAQIKVNGQVVGNFTSVKLDRQLPYEHVVEIDPNKLGWQGPFSMSFTCKLLKPVNLRAMYTDPQWFFALLGYLADKHPKAAKRLRTRKKWRNRAGIAAFGRKRWAEIKGMCIEG